jgi:pSer/pThr/pTyr-binding forkhead associated (FHA) protein
MNVALVMFKEDGQKKEFPLEIGKTVIGRKEDCELRIPLGEISRKHAMMIVEEKQVTLRDLGSANGTYINNKRISEQQVAAGDHIVIGPVVFTVQINGEPSEVRPVQTRLEARSSTLSPLGATPVGGSDLNTADAENIFGDDEQDPLSALEALAASDDTAALDMSDSFPGSDLGD